MLDVIAATDFSGYSLTGAANSLDLQHLKNLESPVEVYTSMNGCLWATLSPFFFFRKPMDLTRVRLGQLNVCACPPPVNSYHAVTASFQWAVVLCVVARLSYVACRLTNARWGSTRVSWNSPLNNTLAPRGVERGALICQARTSQR